MYNTCKRKKKKNFKLKSQMKEIPLWHGDESNVMYIMRRYIQIQNKFTHQTTRDK